MGGQAPGIEVDLGGDDHLVTGDVPLQRPAQVLLTGAGRIAIGGVEEVDSQGEGVADDGFGGVLVHCPVVHGARFAEAHAAYAELGDGDVGVA